MHFVLRQTIEYVVQGLLQMQTRRRIPSHNKAVAMSHAHILISTMLMVHIELLFNNYLINVGNLLSLSRDKRPISGYGLCSCTGYFSLIVKVNKILYVYLLFCLENCQSEWTFDSLSHFCCILLSQQN